MKGHHPKVQIKSTGRDVFVYVGGLRVAKRGRPNTPQAKTWVSLEPGWEVCGEESETIAIKYEGTTANNLSPKDSPLERITLIKQNSAE
jgi:hypothetical protein